nr:uncharacterized protein LOC116770857 [Danaus plexippus plexippus]
MIPKPTSSEEIQLHSNNFQVMGSNPYAYVTRPNYIFTTPTPTPEITNVGYPQPWPNKRPSRPNRPTKPKNPYNSIMNFSPFPDNNFDVTTFPPTSAYTDRIVIRPEEYNGSSDDCPTIFLTLNNTFQGQGKEACPDLNIAVNTNVVNKNVVIESEEDTDTTLTDVFGLPIEESGSEEDVPDYEGSQENDDDVSDNASDEDLELSSYNAANSVYDTQSSESSNIVSSNSPITSVSKPGRPGADDDIFSLTSFIDFFRPAISAFNWLAAINPFSFTAVSFLLTPLILLFAGISSLFAPFALSAREAPHIHIYSPEWQLNKNYRDWQFNSHPSKNEWDQPRKYRDLFKPGFQSAWLIKIQDIFKRITNKLKQNYKDVNNVHRNKRTKRETWTIRVKSSNENKSSKNNNEVAPTLNNSRDVKTKTPVIGESIKKVATQLLQLDEHNSTDALPVVSDTRIPPKLKTQIAHKQKIKNRRDDDTDEYIENSHAGVAVPVTMEELELEKKDVSSETATTSEGLSTWILLSNPNNKDSSLSTEPTKGTELQKKQKPSPPKNKNKKPQNKVPAPKRPIIGSTNKSDLIASGSAINENVYNKIKDTVLSNVQKNKNGPSKKTTLSSTTSEQISEESTTKATTVAKASTKTTKKNAKNKQKPLTSSTTAATPVFSPSAMLPMEAKEQEIELEISTPATTTKKPKRSSTRKKTKTKKRKTTKPAESTTAVTTELKTSTKVANKTKSTNKINKNSKKPNPQATGPFTTQIYNYFSREVMPSVGVGVIGLASILGIASYFLYPFASPVRRTIEVDKKDDIYRNNAEEYGNEGNGQPEEEMLGTVLAGMPIHAKQKINPYAGQTAYINRYPTKKDQDLRYRHVATKYDQNHNVHYPQQKTGIAHGAVYNEPINYNRYQYETRHAYKTEKVYDKGQTYSQYPVVENVYTAPQVETAEISSYGKDASASVVYGVKPSDDTDFKPVYPYETQYQSETTNSPITYPPTSMYLGSNNEPEHSQDDRYEEESNEDSGTIDNKFVVGNVPKELTESATPVVVPEHGPRHFNRKRRSLRRKRNVVTSIEDILKAARQNKDNDIFMSNEIDDGLEVPMKTVSPLELLNSKEDIATNKEVFTVYAVTVDPSKEFSQTEEVSTLKNDIIESVSTLPLDNTKEKSTETEMINEVDATTKEFKVYEVFPSTKPDVVENTNTKSDLTTQFKNLNTETTTEVKSETTSTLPPWLPPMTTTRRPRPFYGTEVITYPPPSSTGFGFFDFLKRVVDFKYRLGLSLLQSTSESINRYLRSMEQSVKRSKDN